MKKMRERKKRKEINEKLCKRQEEKKLNLIESFFMK